MSHCCGCSLAEPLRSAYEGSVGGAADGGMQRASDAEDG